MERLQTIATAYKGYPDTEFIDLGTGIVKGLTGNEHYPTPTRKLPDVQELFDELSIATQTMKTGLKSATKRRNYLRPLAEAALKDLSAYAVGATPGRPDLWAGANFPLTKSETSPRRASQPVTGLVLTDGPSLHTLAASIDAQLGMYSYEWRIFRRDTPAEVLASGFCYRGCTTRKPKAVFENLESGVTYGVECAAWNDTTPMQWSAPVFRTVQ